MRFTRKQGDSLWIDYQASPVADIDQSADAWPGNWSGEYAISTAAGAIPVLSGNVTASATAGLFLLRIGPGTAGWSDMATGSYVLTVQLNNTTVDYRHEEQDTLVITTQGITP